MKRGGRASRLPLSVIAFRERLVAASDALDEAIALNRHCPTSTVGQANVAVALESEDADEFRAYVRGLDLRD